MSLCYGASGVALSLFKSYISGTHQRVKLGITFRHHLSFHDVFRRVQF